MRGLHTAETRSVTRPAPRQSGRTLFQSKRLRPVKAASTDEVCSVSDPNCEFPDPEAKFRKYGKFFGKAYKLSFDWLENAPRVRVRRAEEAAVARQREELVDLAVVNARLAGSSPWEARKELEYLKLKRENWEKIYNYVTKQDAAATISLIHEASRKVEEALSEEARERISVTDLKEELVQLQSEVDSASKALNLTQARVNQNLQRINELKAEAAALERMKTMQAYEAKTAVAEPQTGAIPQSAAGAASTSTLPRTAGKARRSREKGLHSSLEIEENLRNFWYPAEFSNKLQKDTLVPFEIFGEQWVLFRDEFGAASCVRDECAHRACPLSLGTVEEGRVVCPYHGWQYNGDGACTKMPSTLMCKGIAVSALPTAEKDGFIWVWPGRGPPPAVPSFAAPPPGFEIHAEIMVDVPVEHGLLMENLLDLAHAPFTHTTTFARGWPIPDIVKFHANKLLSGSWDPYPIDMSFEPPCMVLSTIGLAQPGQIVRGARAAECEKHLHQLHICMPSKRGHTRLLYRMSLDFMPWAKYIPGIQMVWKNVAAQVLGEDLVLVKGQQDRLIAGSSTWANPVSYDKLAVRYRRWRNTVADGDLSSAARQRISMNAGELFSPEDSVLEEESAVL